MVARQQQDGARGGQQRRGEQDLDDVVAGADEVAAACGLGGCEQLDGGQGRVEYADGDCGGDGEPGEPSGDGGGRKGGGKKGKLLKRGGAVVAATTSTMRRACSRRHEMSGPGGRETFPPGPGAIR